MALGLQTLILATLGAPWIVRAGLLVSVLAPVSCFLGLFFPLGLARVGQGGALPWAWALNGAFSVLATPLANLIAREFGFSRLLLAAALLYAAAALCFPARRKSFRVVDLAGAPTRRGLIPPALAVPFIGSARAETAWTRTAFEKAMANSGRPVSLTDDQFQTHPEAQARGDEADRELPGMPAGTADPAVMAAFQAVPREYFHYIYSEHRTMRGRRRYESDPKPWAIGWGSALSDYLGQAYMTQVCAAKARR